MTASAWKPYTQIGLQQIDQTSTVKNHPLGTIVRAHHGTYGEGEFIYLKGVASTAVGSLVSYNQSAGTTTLSANTANLTTPVAVAMSANVANQYGWYQIDGAAVIQKATGVAISPSVALYQSATAGALTSTVASGKQLQSAISANTASVASATTTVLVQINRPAFQGSAV
jgi:hypothetical protein